MKTDNYLAPELTTASILVENGIAASVPENTISSTDWSEGNTDWL